MQRRVGAILKYLVGACLCIAPNHATRAESRPNVLIIVADDQAPSSLAAYGGTVDTPHLDLLAAEGLTFDAARHMGAWSGAVCTPSRHMIMTGRSVWRIPGSPAKDQLVPKDLADHCLAQVFNDAGYATFRTCKSGNSYLAANARFQVRREATKRGGQSQKGSPWHAEQVLAYLDKLKATGDEKPWLIYLGFSHPHDPRNGPADLLDKYGAISPGPPSEPNSLAPSLPENYLPEHPFPLQRNLRDEVSVQGVDKRRDEATVRNELGKQAACVESIDTQVGRVLEKLRADGLLDNTFVFYTSDHGIAVGCHGLMGKQNLYEHSWRVPFIVRGPGVPAGERTDAMIYLGELMPTVCELTGIKIPESVDTESFADVLRGQSEKHHEVQYGVYAGGTKPGIRAVTDGRWKLIKYDLFNGAVRETQLFDLQNNPHELLTGDLSDDAEHAETRQRLETLLKSESTRWGDPYRLSH